LKQNDFSLVPEIRRLGKFSRIESFLRAESVVIDLVMAIDINEALNFSYFPIKVEREKN
jgi:hypothetical protein